MEYRERYATVERAIMASYGLLVSGEGYAEKIVDDEGKDVLSHEQLLSE